MADKVYPHSWTREGFLGDAVVTQRPHPIIEYSDVVGVHAPRRIDLTAIKTLDAADPELTHAIKKENSLDDAITRYEAAMFSRSGELAESSNTALTRLFGTTSPDAPHLPPLPPDHAQEHENDHTRAAEYRSLRAAHDHVALVHLTTAAVRPGAVGTA